MPGNTQEITTPNSSVRTRDASRSGSHDFSPSRQRFALATLPDFLQSGWLLSLNSSQILVGWGEWQESSHSLSTENQKKSNGRSESASDFVQSAGPSLPAESMSDFKGLAESKYKGKCSIYAPDFYLKNPKPWRHTRHFDVISFNQFAALVLAFVADDVNGEVETQKIENTGAELNSKLNGKTLFQSGFESQFESASDKKRLDADLPLREALRALNRFQWQEPDFSQFDRQWISIQKGFSERGLKKAVPVVFGKAQAKMDVVRRLKTLLSLLGGTEPAHRNLYLYGMWGEKEGVSYGMVGATPEILFTQRNPEELETVALAGTRGKSNIENPAASLLADPKERYEHQLVLDDVQEVLGRMGMVSTGETKTVELPTLYHLKTSVRARLNKTFDFSDCVRLLHPTPALGLAPRAMGFSEMYLWEPTDERHRYGAPFGVELELPDGQKIRHCVVAIRNIQWQGNEVYLGSGCGVVPDSVLQREWRELQLKRESVKRILDV